MTAKPSLKIPKFETVPISKLKAWSRNPRKNHAVDAIVKSIEAFGYLAPIVVQAGTYRIIAGHGRIAGLKKMGAEEVPVVVAEISDRDADLYTIADNKLTERADWDDEVLAQLLGEFKVEGLDLGLAGFDLDEAHRIINDFKDQPEEDAIPVIPETPVSAPGDVWELGGHRLLCGDSTKADDVAKVLAGERPLLMVTDPPYGVDYDPEWRNEAGLRDPGGREGKVENDDRADWTAAWRLFPGDVVYCWHAGIFARDVAEHLGAAGFKVRAQVIWAKPRFAISRGHYHWQHEPCWYAVKKGATAKWAGDRSQTTLWQIPIKDNTGETIHGTQKPVECMMRPIRNHGGQADHVYEPFSGSGTTIIAAEQLGRRCFAIEISPGYVDVAVMRWQNFTKQKAKNLTRPGVTL